MLYNILIHGVTIENNRQNQDVNIYIYADDMTLSSDNIEELKVAMDLINDWAGENEMALNENKTELIGSFQEGRKNSRERPHPMVGTKVKSQKLL